MYTMIHAGVKGNVMYDSRIEWRQQLGSDDPVDIGVIAMEVHFEN